MFCLVVVVVVKGDGGGGGKGGGGGGGGRYNGLLAYTLPYVIRISSWSAPCGVNALKQFKFFKLGNTEVQNSNCLVKVTCTSCFNYSNPFNSTFVNSWCIFYPITLLSCLIISSSEHISVDEDLTYQQEVNNATGKWFKF